MLCAVLVGGIRQRHAREGSDTSLPFEETTGQRGVQRKWRVEGDSNRTTTYQVPTKCISVMQTTYV